MRVLFAQNIAAIAGSEKYFLQLLPELKKNSVDVSFFNFYLKENKKLALSFSTLLQESGIEVFNFQTTSYVSFSLINALRKCILNQKIEILHTHLVYADFLGAILKKVFRLKIKFISTLHGYQENLYFKYCLTPSKLPKTLYYHIMRFALNQMDGVYACSFGLKKFFDEIGLKPKSTKIEVIHHGFDYPALSPEVVRRLKFASPQLIIVGRLVERKGHILILKELHWLIQQFPDLKLIIAGDGELKSKLEEYVEKQGLQRNVVFLGYREDTLELMAASDVVLVPSYSEGLPLVIFEAFHSGTPVVAFDTIGCNEGIEAQTTGLIAKPFNALHFLELVNKLLTEDGLSKKIADQGRVALKNRFNLKTMTVNTMQFYKKIIS